MFLQNKICHLLVRSYSVTSQNVPVVKLPQYVVKYVEQTKKKANEKRLELLKKISYRGNTSIPVIKSAQKEFNFYLGQVYNRRYALPLQSRYWLKEKTSGQKFTIVPWSANPSLPVSITEDCPDDMRFPTEFSELNLNCDILDSLKELNLKSPTPIQVLAIPRIVEHQHVLLAAESGCGKTVAYLAPILNNIMSIKKSMNSYPETPLAAVIVPGRELAEQIAEVAYSLGKSCNIDVKLVMSDGTNKKHLKLHPNSNVDLLVASVGTLAKLFSKGILKLSNLQSLVLDEADTLLDDSFFEDVKYILQKLTIRNRFSSGEKTLIGTQLVFVSSIYPSSIDSIYSDSLTDEDIYKIKSPYLHRVQPHVVQKFWRVSRKGRAGELLDLVKSDYQKKRPVLIFSNQSPTCDWMSLFLEENGVPNVKFHGAVPPNTRLGVLKAFNEGYVDVMCCTDLASRGIDTQRVKHVINFDFPNSVSDYILRAGRVGRVSSNQGHVTNLVMSKSGVYTVQEIEKSIREASKIANVDSNIKRKIRQLYFSP